MKISNKNEEDRFQKHISQEYNSKIIFSGIYGIGKTHFLTEFFNKYKNSYISYHLSPVNYSISNNEDIISYLKFDLGVELIKKDFEFKKESFSFTTTTKNYIYNNAISLSKELIKKASEVNKLSEVVVKGIFDLSEKLKEYRMEMQINEKEELISFLGKIQFQDGSIYEENFITQLISNTINFHKTTNSELQHVLIIDDLDRMDPGHVFRILNVFSSHLNYNEDEGNKFNFDKIILVCDINNIKSIFNHYYGKEADFNGYIDKFYSTEVFHLNNKQIIKENLNEILNSVKIENDYIEYLNLKTPNLFTCQFINFILTEMILKGVISFRLLINIKDKSIHLPSINISRSEMSNGFSNIEIPYFMIFEFLSILFGSPENLKIAVEKITKTIYIKKVDDNFKFIFQNIICLADILNHKLQQGKFDYKNKKSNITIRYSLETNFGDIKFVNIENITTLDGKTINEIDINSLIANAFEAYLFLK